MRAESRSRRSPIDAASLDAGERRDWLRLSLSENVGPATFHALVRQYGGAGAAIEALPELSRRGGLKRTLKLCPEDKAIAILDHIEDLGARLVAHVEDDYPPLLTHIDDAPPLVCLAGNSDLASRPTVAIVGARNASALGRKFARTLAGELCAAGYTVVSGLARGIDTAAHEASVEHATAAVVAGGIDVFYPPENQTLQEEIARSGLLLSEMMPGTRPQAQHFPRRNRLISGMSLGVIVIEAAGRSGSLITARMALEQNREVLAVPGSPLDPRSEGTNRLIRDGAALVRNVDDVLEILNPLAVRAESRATPFRESDGGSDLAGTSEIPAGDAHARIVELLGPTPVEIDEVIRESGLDTRIVLAVLLEMELAGRLERHPQQRVSLVPD